MSSAAARIASRWITFEDAKEALQLGDDSLRRLLLAGDIYGKKVGKEWRIDIETIEALLESDRAAARIALSKLRK